MILEKLKSKLKAIEDQKQALLDEVKLPEDIRNVRFDMCKNCDHFFAPTSLCNKCGCYMPVKTYLPFSSCPIGKWAKISIKEQV